MRLEFALWCWGHNWTRGSKFGDLAGCWWGNLPPRSWSTLYSQNYAPRCMESSKEVTWAGGKGQRPSQTEDRRPCVLQFICGCHRQDMAEMERYRGGEGKKNQTKKTDQKVYPEPTPDRDPPGATGYSVLQVKGGRRSGWLPTWCLIQQLTQKQETTGRGCRSK